MRWCAGHFEDVVDYGQTVESVDVDEIDDRTGSVKSFRVTSYDEKAGHLRRLRARHVVVAVGGKPSFPKSVDQNNPRIIHSSQYATSIPDLFPTGKHPQSIAVIGSGQSAVEVLHNLPRRFPGCKVRLLIRGAALRPSDDSPFVNEIFNPSRVDDVYSQQPEIRAQDLALDRGTNYGVVRLELLEEIYSTLYSYRVQYKNEDDWPQQILSHREVVGMEECHDSEKSPIRLHIRNSSGEHHAYRKPLDEILDVDLVVVVRVS